VLVLFARKLQARARRQLPPHMPISFYVTNPLCGVGIQAHVAVLRSRLYESLKPFDFRVVFVAALAVKLCGFAKRLNAPFKNFGALGYVLLHLGFVTGRVCRLHRKPARNRANNKKSYSPIPKNERDISERCTCNAAYQ
jgi:hypothetical protein